MREAGNALAPFARTGRTGQNFATLLRWSTFLLVLVCFSLSFAFVPFVLVELLSLLHVLIAF